VLTSNVGSEFVNRSAIGFDETAPTAHAKNRYEEMVRQQLKERFRPELLNRLDRVIVFHPLERETLKSIVKKELQLVLDRVQEAQKVACSVNAGVLEWLMKQDLRADEGARSARRIVEREIVSLISQTLLENAPKRKWRLKVTNDKLVVVK